VVEELYLLNRHRDLFDYWMRGELTLEEAVFLAQRVDFSLVIYFLPVPWILALLRVYDYFFEPVCTSKPTDCTLLQ
jgi:hypothetical protein